MECVYTSLGLVYTVYLGLFFLWWTFHSSSFVFVSLFLPLFHCSFILYVYLFINCRLYTGFFLFLYTPPFYIDCKKRVHRGELYTRKATSIKELEDSLRYNHYCRVRSCCDILTRRSGFYIRSSTGVFCWLFLGLTPICSCRIDHAVTESQERASPERCWKELRCCVVVI